MKAVPIQRVNHTLLLGVLTVIILYYARHVLIPLVFAILLAMFMAPVCRKLESKRINRPLSVSICVFILLVAFLAILAIVTAQVASFNQDLPQVEQKVQKLVSQLQVFLEDQFNIAPERQRVFLKQQLTSIGQSVVKYIRLTATMLMTILGGILLTLVYTFLLLYHKEKYETFFLRLYTGENKEEVREMISKITRVAQQYLTGRVISIILLTMMYAIGLFIIGIKNALLLSGIAALLTFIPYIGPFLGGLFPVLMAVITEDSFQPALWVVAILFFIQAIDNYFIEPYVIGGEVNLSAIATIFIIIAGGFIWGVAGMIVFIPLLAIAKIIFDHVESLKPYGYLIGDPAKSASSKAKEWLKILFRKK